MSAEYEKGLLSICMVGYNHAKYAKAAVDAVNKLRYDKVELIVLDDGSKDGTGDVLTALVDNSRVRLALILQENTGNVGHNNNVALKQAKGEFVSMISLDDMLIPEKIDDLIRQIMEEKDLAFIASTQIKGVNENGEEEKGSVPPIPLDEVEHPSITDLLEMEYEKFGAFYVQGAIFRRCVIDAVGGFDEDMTGDDIILRTKVFRYLKDNPNWRFKLLSEPTCLYRQHDANIHHNSMRQIQIVTEYLQRYWPDRPDPEMLYKWTMHTVRHMDIAALPKLFSLNARAKHMLFNGKYIAGVIRILFERMIHPIYYKTKDGDQRIITLLSRYKFSYSRKRHKR